MGLLAFESLRLSWVPILFFVLFWLVQVDDEHPEWLEAEAIPGKEKEEGNDEDTSAPGYVPKDLREYSV